MDQPASPALFRWGYFDLALPVAAIVEAQPHQQPVELAQVQGALESSQVASAQRCRPQAVMTGNASRASLAASSNCRPSTG